MTFRTTFTPVKSAPINPYEGVALLGSCFADNIGAKLREALVPAVVNPVGPLFNPLSIARVIRCALGQEEVRKFDWHGESLSWDAARGYDPDRSIAEIARALSDFPTIILTLGTAIVYETDGRPVVNCLKMPASMFTRRMAGVREIVDTLTPLLNTLSDKRILLTLSPVRHLKEGFADNSLSKATLRVAIDEICLSTGAEYFPAYEILTDDLRDYRFYADDMQHPSAPAIDYIWQMFADTYFTPAERENLRRGLDLSRRLNHRHLHPDSPEAAAFDAETQRLLSQAPAYFSIPKKQ